MSIASELTNLQTNISNAYDAINTKGGTLPANKNTANLATAIDSISGGGGKIGDFNIISGKITPDADNYQLVGVMSYNDFLEEVGGTMPSYVFAGVFDAQCLTSTLGFAHSFSVEGLKASAHYKNNSTTMTRSALQGTIGLTQPVGLTFFGYSGSATAGAGYFKAGVEYTWFILWKN